MREKTVKRFYCDYCPKQMATRAGMGRHEKHCTCNPVRACRMCGWMQEFDEEVSTLSLVERSEIYQTLGWIAFRKAVHECPACTLSTIRQVGWLDTPMTGFLNEEFTVEGLLNQNTNEKRSLYDFKQDCTSFFSRWKREPDYGMYY